MTSIIQAFLLTVASMLASPSQSIDIVFAGDAMQHQRQLDAARQPDGSYDYTPYYRAIRPYIESADYAVVNLETPLGGAPYSGYPMFCAPDSYLSALKDAGFDLILTANNHALDRRDKGLRRTVATIQDMGLPWIGTYSNAAQRAEVLPRIIDVQGFRIAFLNYTYGTNGITIQGDAIVDHIDRTLMARDISEARRAGAEIVAVAVHWGDEYHLLPNESQQSLADFLTDQGVDLIIGGHPHVIQPMEIRHSDRHDKDVFLCYSLGNFISGMRKTDTRGGATARITLTRDSLGHAIVDKATYRMVFVLPPDRTCSNFRLISSEQDAPAEISAARDAFVRNARTIFDRHNVRVPLDTVSLWDYNTRMMIQQCSLPDSI